MEEDNMLDLARRINAEEIAVREHIPDRKAIYVLVTDLESQIQYRVKT